MFGVVGIVRGGFEERGRERVGGEGKEGGSVAEEGYGFGEEGTRYGGPYCGEEGFVDDERLGGVAGCWIVDLKRDQSIGLHCSRRKLTFESTTTLTAVSSSADSSRYTEQIPSAWPITGIRVPCWILRTSALLPRGMTRSIY